MLIPQLKTQRLILRGLCEQDLDAYAEMCAEPEIIRYIGDGEPLSRSQAWRNMAMVLGHWQLRGYGMWAVQKEDKDEMIGIVGCWQPEGWPELEIGWTLRRNYWGFGYATEAARAAMNYAFEQLQQSHVISLIAPDNLASRRVAERLGERIEQKTVFLGSEVLIYAMRQEDWKTKSLKSPNY